MLSFPPQTTYKMKKQYKNVDEVKSTQTERFDFQKNMVLSFTTKRQLYIIEMIHQVHQQQQTMTIIFHIIVIMICGLYSATKSKFQKATNTFPLKARNTSLLDLTHNCT